MSIFADLKQIVDQYKSEFNGKGVVALIDSAGVIDSYGIGSQSDFSIDEKRMMCLGRISELVVATAILDLHVQEKLKVTDSIGTHMIIMNDNINHEITINELLRHSSGLPSYLNENIDKLLVGSKAYITPQTLLDQVDSSLFEPGKRIEYSPTNYLILSLIIEKVTDSPFEIYMYQYLQNLGLENFHPYFNENFEGLAYPTLSGNFVTKTIASKQYSDILKGFGTFYASADEINNFLNMLFVEQKLLPMNFLNFILSPVGENYNAVGFDLKLIGNHSYYVNESQQLGSQSYLYYDPRRNLKIIVLSNDSESNTPYVILDKILQKYN